MRLTEAGKKTVQSLRERCLNKAKQIVCGDRNNEYGEPEDNFKVIAGYWEAYLDGKYEMGIPLDSEDVANMMVLFKMGRITTSKTYKEDSYIDMAGYTACAMECAKRKQDDLRKMNRELVAEYGNTMKAVNTVDISPENV